jgi:NitT/TauT family transport system substrate-binding protein
MKRSSMVAACGAVLLLRALPARAQTAPAVRVGTAFIEEAALPYYASENGFFKTAGVDVDLQVFTTGGGAITAALLGGSLDIAVTNSGSLASAHSHGLGLCVVACGSVFSPSAPSAHLAVNKTLGVRTAKDLSGRTLAVTTTRDMIQAAVMEWIDKNGGDSKSVNFIEMPSTEMAAATVAKRIDGATIVEPLYSKVKDQMQELGLPYAAVADGKPFQTLGQVGKKEWVERNPAVARRFAAAIHAAAQWANRNHADATTLLARYTKIDPQIVATIPRMRYAEANDPALVQPVIDMMAHYGILPRGFPATEVFTTAVG